MKRTFFKAVIFSATIIAGVCFISCKKSAETRNKEA